MTLAKWMMTGLVAATGFALTRCMTVASMASDKQSPAVFVTKPQDMFLSTAPAYTLGELIFLRDSTDFAGIPSCGEAVLDGDGAGVTIMRNSVARGTNVSIGEHYRNDRSGSDGFADCDELAVRLVSRYGDTVVLGQWANADASLYRTVVAMHWKNGRTAPSANAYTDTSKTQFIDRAALLKLALVKGDFETAFGEGAREACSDIKTDSRHALNDIIRPLTTSETPPPLPSHPVWR